MKQIDKRLYTIEEAQIIWTKIINNRAEELKLKMQNNKDLNLIKSNSQKLAYV